MLSKCANPGCPASFLYLHQGKLFRLDTSCRMLPARPAATKKPSRSRGIFLAVRQCAGEVTLGYKQGIGHPRLCPCRKRGVEPRLPREGVLLGASAAG